MHCIFCSIIKRELPASFVYEDDIAAAFLDIAPINKGHVLVILKRHEAWFGNLTEEEAGYLFKIGKRVLTAIQASSIPCEGANLFLSDGVVAGQEVMHSHLHILPRLKDDGYGVGFSHVEATECPRRRLDHIALEIASFFK